MKSILLLPAYNELEAMKFLIPMARQYFDHIFVVDGGSHDGSINFYEQNGLVYLVQNEPGKAHGVIDALRVILPQDYDCVALIDADMTCHPEDAYNHSTIVAHDQIIIGNRFSSGKPEAMEWFSYLVNILVSSVVSLRCRTRIHDVQSPFWILSQDAVNRILPLLQAEHFDLEVDMAITASDCGIQLLEAPISFHERIGQSKFSIRQRFKQIWKVIYHIIRPRAI